MAYEGVRIDTNASVTLLKNLTVSNSGSVGIYVDAPAGSIIGLDVTGSGAGLNIYQYSQPTLSSELYTTSALGTVSGTFAGNAGWGAYLVNPGSVVVNASTISGNGYGLYIYNVYGADGPAVVGDATLTAGLGNTVHDNTNYGLLAYGTVTIAGNVVYNEGGGYGIEAAQGASAVENVVWAAGTGIIGDGATLINANRVYDITGIGVEDLNDVYNTGTVTISNNVIYSTGTGLVDARYYNLTATIANNLIYANTVAAIQAFGDTNLSVINNTIDQPTGDGIDISNGTSLTTLRNNIFVIGSGTAISVAADSESGFTSDYNLFYLPNGTTGAVGIWQAVARVTLGAWQVASSTDANSFVANPLFVNPTGSEGTLGFVSTAKPGYDDDFHLQSKYADFRGGSLAPVIVNGKAAFPAIAGEPIHNNRRRSTGVVRPIATRWNPRRTAVTSISAISGIRRRHRKAPPSTYWCCPQAPA